MFGSSLSARSRRCGLALAVAGTVLLATASTALGSGRIYWSNFDGGTIGWANLNGSSGGLLNTGSATVTEPQGTALDPATGKIYWSNAGPTASFSWANLDGSGGGNLTLSGGPAPSHPWGLALDPAAGKLYWSDYGSDSIGYANLDGSGEGTIFTHGITPNGPSGLTVDPALGKVYWTDYGDNEIEWANLDGSAAGTLNTGSATVDAPSGLAIDPDNNVVYWANEGAGSGTTIGWAKLDGSGSGDLNTAGATVAAPTGVAVDPSAGKVYWGGYQGGNIGWANVDGSGGGNLAAPSSSLDRPVMPTLLETPNPAGTPNVSGSKALGSKLTCSQGSWSSDIVEAFLYRAPQSFAYQWTRNGTPITGATSTSEETSSVGSYACTVTATNAAGSTQQTSPAVTVAVAALPRPNTKLTKSSISQAKHRASFHFKAIGKTTGFQCALVRHGRPKYRTCHSPKTYKHLKAGHYTFYVRARNASGPDTTPARHRFKIK